MPLQDGRELARRNGIFEKLLPILDYVPGNQSPPPAPKHTTAASNKPKIPKMTAASRRAAASTFLRKPPLIHRANDRKEALAAQSVIVDDPPYEAASHLPQSRDMTPDNTTIASYDMSNAYEDTHPDFLSFSNAHSTNTTPLHPNSQRKRKRAHPPHFPFQTGSHSMPGAPPPLSLTESLHLTYGDSLLDYFLLTQPSTKNHLLQSPSNHEQSTISPPTPPPNFDPSHPIDPLGHTPLHWSTAMGNLQITRSLLTTYRASPLASSHNGETPLMRAVLFTNAHDLETFPALLRLLEVSIPCVDHFGSSVFHHLAATTGMRRYRESARGYCEVLVNRLRQMEGIGGDEGVRRVLDMRDGRGDTALNIAAGFGARKLVRSLIGHGASSQIRNDAGENADLLLARLHGDRGAGDSALDDKRGQRMGSSSPFLPDVWHGEEISGRSTTRGRQVWTSDAAKTLDAGLVKTMREKGRLLATAFDREVTEKEGDLREARRLLEVMEGERESVRREMIGVEVLEIDPELDATEEAELQQLERECQAVVENEQRRELRRLVELEDRALLNGAINGAHVEVADDAERSLVIDQLRVEQEQRKELVARIVQSESEKGPGGGERVRQYRGLIAKALGMEIERVEECLSGVLEELEVWDGE